MNHMVFGQSPVPNARLEVFKARRQMVLYSGQKPVRTFRVALGLKPVGPKVRQGDRATPEGTYRITHKNPNSQYYKSLGVSYPNAQDARRGVQSGLITQTQYNAIVSAVRRGLPPPSQTALGGDIFLHGRGSATDWTWGCIALDDSDMDYLFRIVPVGTPVLIHP